MQMEVHDLITARVSIRDDITGHFKLVQSRLYYKFQSALQDVIDGSPELFDGIPKKYLPENFKNPQIVYSGVDPKTDRPTDFEFRYFFPKEYTPNMVVWIGTVTIEDEIK